MKKLNLILESAGQRFLIPPAINVDISRKYYENKN